MLPYVAQRASVAA